MTEEELKKVKAKQIMEAYLPCMPTTQHMLLLDTLTYKYIKADIIAVREAYEQYKEKVKQNTNNESPS